MTKHKPQKFRVIMYVTITQGDEKAKPVTEAGAKRETEVMLRNGFLNTTHMDTYEIVDVLEITKKE